MGKRKKTRKKTQSSADADKAWGKLSPKKKAMAQEGMYDY